VRSSLGVEVGGTSPSRWVPVALLQIARAPWGTWRSPARRQTPPARLEEPQVYSAFPVGARSLCSLRQAYTVPTAGLQARGRLSLRAAPSLRVGTRLRQTSSASPSSRPLLGPRVILCCPTPLLQSSVQGELPLFPPLLIPFATAPQAVTFPPSPNLAPHYCDLLFSSSLRTHFFLGGRRAGLRVGEGGLPAGGPASPGRVRRDPRALRRRCKR